MSIAREAGQLPGALGLVCHDPGDGVLTWCTRETAPSLQSPTDLAHPVRKKTNRFQSVRGTLWIEFVAFIAYSLLPTRRLQARCQAGLPGMVRGRGDRVTRTRAPPGGGGGAAVLQAAYLGPHRCWQFSRTCQWT